jgi:hypothetical protein
MRRAFLAGLTAVCLSLAVLADADPAEAATVDSQDLLNGRLVESWGACELPEGFVVVHHDGWTSAGQAVGMRLFSGTDAGAEVLRRWSRYSPSGLAPDRHDCVSADYDHNGLVDFYVTAGRGSDNETKEDGRGNELWLQTTPGVFSNHAPTWGVEEVCGRSHYAATADFNRDGWMDIYVGNAAPRAVALDPCDSLPGSETSHLYLNAGGTHFVDSTTEWGLSGYGGVHCAEGVQFAGTKAPDLIVCRDQGLAVLKNLGDRFVDRRVRFGIPATNWKQATIGDVTLDGVPDLITATSSAVQVWPGVRSPATTVLNSSSIHGLGVNPYGDIYVLRSNPYTDLTNPADVVLVRETEDWSQAWAPDAAGVGDFVLWLEGAQAWLVGNGISDQLGPLQLVRTLP